MKIDVNFKSIDYKDAGEWKDWRLIENIIFTYRFKQNIYNIYRKLEI